MSKLVATNGAFDLVGQALSAMAPAGASSTIKAMPTLTAAPQ